MSLVSFQFLIYFIFILIVYFLLPGSVQWIWLLLSSLAYYCINAGVEKSIFFLIFILINYCTAIFFDEESKQLKTKASRKRLYASTVVFDVLVLAVFKYSGFLHDIFVKGSSLFGFNPTGEIYSAFYETVSRFEPLHISYFLLIVIGYITDVYWGKCRAMKNPGKMLLFSSYFPQMMSGPIVRYNQMEKHLWGEKNRFSYDRVARGTMRVIWGLFKKMVISSRCAIIVDEIYGKYEIYPGLYIIFATIMYAMQLYTDFSGLMDIVLGISEILGIPLPENFKAPFFAQSIAEFWRRWHITLGEFLRDYVLRPLQRRKWYKFLREVCKNHLGSDYKKKYNIPAYLSLLVSWFLIGLWHGGGWNYIWGVGIYMWAIIVISELLTPFFSWIVRVLRINTQCFSYVLFRRVRTFLLYIYGLSFFRAESLKQGFSIWKSAFSIWNPWIFFDQSIFSLGLDRREFAIVIFGLLLVLVVSGISEQKDMDITDWLLGQNYLFRLFVCAVLFACVIVWGYYGMNFNATDFIYGRF